MLSAREEFLNHTNGIVVKCAILKFDCECDENEQDFVQIKLKVGYNDIEYQKFLSDIDREYDHGYGSQELDGTIWYEDGNWSERAEHNGSEWWVYRTMPLIPKSLKSSTVNTQLEYKMSKLFSRTIEFYRINYEIGGSEYEEKESYRIFLESLNAVK